MIVPSFAISTNFPEAHESGRKLKNQTDCYDESDEEEGEKRKQKMKAHRELVIRSLIKPLKIPVKKQSYRKSFLHLHDHLFKYCLFLL